MYLPHHVRQVCLTFACVHGRNNGTPLLTCVQRASAFPQKRETAGAEGLPSAAPMPTGQTSLEM
jgi:hypothetical protein